MLIKYINLENFEVTDKVEGFIECDWEIADAIALLNKKGYKTLYSCAGHNKNGSLMRTNWEPIENYQTWIKEYGEDKSCHLVEVDDKYFYYKDEEHGTYTYVLFDKKYDFENAPLGFEIEEFDGKTNVGKNCYFFADSKKGIRRKDKDIDKELLDNQKNLYEWAKSLKYINRKGE